MATEKRGLRNSQLKMFIILDKIKNPPAKITSGFTKHYIKDKLPLFSLFNLFCLKIYAYYLYGQIQKGT